MENNKLTITLKNNTNLPSSEYSIYVLGFTTTSKKMLCIANGKPTIASFVKIQNEKGTLPTFNLDNNQVKVQVDIPSPFSEDDKIDGARIYFFVAEKTKFPEPPHINYENFGAQVTNVKNPPTTEVPPYSFCEFTVVDPTYGPVIDVQTVDGFVMPITITFDWSSVAMAVGQPSNITRQDIITSYKPFVNQLGKDAAPFLNLQYDENSGGLLNPGQYLISTNPKNEFLNLGSKLNSWFDRELQSLFSNTNLSIQGVSGGQTIARDIYTGTPVSEQPIPGNENNLSHPALQFKGTNNKQEFTVFNPIGLCIMSYSGANSPTAITGVLDNATLTFTNPLPKETNLMVGMYVSGAGTDPNHTYIASIATDSDHNITGVTLAGSTLTGKTPVAQFRFSKVPGMFMTSGAMVFANAGVFAFAEGLNVDQQAVQLNIQNQIVSALNRGVANSIPQPSLGEEKETNGYASKYWGTQTNWYPESTRQNLFSLFMHTGKANNIPIFIQASNSVECARHTTMGQAYGFAYDENAGPVPPAPPKQPLVPSKFDPLPKNASNLTVTLGAWK